MSVRSRVDAFEALSQKEVETQQRDNLNNETRKRFNFPCKSTSKNPESEAQQAGNNILSNKSSKETQDFDADLQQVWSVRKNIPHKGGPTASHHCPRQQGQVNFCNTTSSLANQNKSTPVQYSKHGAVPTLSAHTNRVQPPIKKQQLSRGYDRLQLKEPKRNPLQDNNHSSPWNAKLEAPAYNSLGAGNGMSKRPIASTPPSVGTVCLPSPKRRTKLGEMEVARSIQEHQPVLTNVIVLPKSKTYAKRMAQGYLKSMGMGEYTPKTSFQASKTREQEPSKTAIFLTDNRVSNRKKKMEDQDSEFDFDI